MSFAVIQRCIFRAKVIGYGITRRKPSTHLLDAGATLLCSAVRSIFGSGFVCGFCCHICRFLLLRNRILLFV